MGPVNCQSSSTLNIFQNKLFIFVGRQNFVIKRSSGETYGEAEFATIMVVFVTLKVGKTLKWRCGLSIPVPLAC